MNTTIKPSPCRTCGSLYHSAMYHKPKAPIKTNVQPPRAPRPCKWCGVANVHLEFQCPLLPKTPLKQVGKSHKKWMQTRKQWLEVNTYPVHTCHYCRKVVTTSEMTLDHKVPRSRAPELRYDFGNLVPACASCNGLKGSVDHDHYRHECPDIKTDHVKETT